MSERQPRVFVGLCEISGYYAALARGFAAIGVDCEYVVLTEHPFSYDAPLSRAWAVRVARLAYRLRGRLSGRGLLWFGVTALCCAAARGLVLLWALLRCDAFIFGFCSTFYGYQEFPLLKALGKRVVCVFHGSDSRPPYMDGGFGEGRAAPSLDQYVMAARKKRRTIAAIEKYADVVVSHPPMALFEVRPFVAGLWVGIPFEARRTRAPVCGLAGGPTSRRRSGVRVLHAPSARLSKGTAQIVEAVDRLRGEGLDIELVEVSGKPHAVVMAEMACCDFVVDQLYSDTPMATFATEAAFHGKAAVVGGYYAACLHEDYPEAVIPPSVYCHPDEVAAAIRRLATDVAFREELGRKARDFVVSNWAPSAVAARYLRLVKGDIPAAWLYDPRNVRYVHGALISEASLKQIVRGLLDAYGPAVLQLDDKPQLLRRLCGLVDTATGRAC